MSNNSKLGRGWLVKYKEGSTKEIYKIITVGDQAQIISTQTNKTEFVKSALLRRITPEELKEHEKSSSLSNQPHKISEKTSPQPTSAAKQPSQKTVAKQMEDAPPAAADKPAETEPISTAPSSDAPVQTSENDLTPQTDDATNAINPILPVSSSTLELKDIERIVDEAFTRRDKEMEAIPVLYSFVRGLVEKLTGKSDSLPNATKTSTKDLQTALEQLKDEVKKLQDEVKKLEGEVKKLEGEVKKLEGERDSAKDEALRLAKELEKEQVTSGQSRSDLADEKRQNKIAEGEWETERGKLNDDFGIEKQRAKEESEKLRGEIDKSKRTVKDALITFWEGRQEFYGGLHRSIIDLYREEDRGRRQSSIDTRFDALQADINLLTSLGCQVMLDREALDFGRCSFNPFVHEPSSEDRGIPSGEMATVFLPGWTYGDPPTKVRPILGRQEINQ